MVLPPKQLVDVKEEEKEEPLQLETIGADIKQIIRGINTQGQFGQDGSEPVDVVNDYIRSYFAQGYKLVHVQHLRSNRSPEGNAVLSEQMLYVLYKEA